MTEDWKRMMTSLIENMPDEHFARAVPPFLKALKSRRGPKERFVFDKLISETKKRGPL